MKWLKNFPTNRANAHQPVSSVAAFTTTFRKHLFRIQDKLISLTCLKRTLIGGFSCVNTCLAFDSKVLFPRGAGGTRKENFKLIYEIRNTKTNELEDKRTVSYILKMIENKQYRNTMPKLLLTGSIEKVKKTSTIREVDLLIQNISDEDKIGHLFIVDIEFDEVN